MLLVRFLQSVIVLSVLGIVLVLFQAGASASGITIFTSDYQSPGSTQALGFEGPEILRVFQAELQSNRPDFYTFKASSGTFLKAQLNTLRLAGQDNFKPALALFGPGLPAPTVTDLKLLSFSLPPGTGLLVSVDEKDDRTARNTVDEPWTQATYWERQSLLNALPETGTYYLAVFNRAPESGKYALSVGDQIQAGWRETLTFPVTWARTHLWFNDYWWPGLAVALAALLLARLLYLYLRSLRRQLHTTALERANRRRRRLITGVIPANPAGRYPRRAVLITRYARRPRLLARSAIAAGLVPGYPAAENVLKTAGLMNGAVVLPVSAAGSSQARTRVFTEWEPVTTPASGNTNGHAQPVAATGSEESSRAQAANQDGLSRWGQRRRPDRPDREASGKQ